MPTSSPQGSTAQTLTAGLVVHFVSSVREVFTTMLSTTVNVATPHRKNDPAPTNDVSAVIGFSGQAVGSMVLTFDRETAERIVAAFTGAPVATNSPDFADAIGELANMIAGAAKKYFGAVASISIPSVIIGPGHTVARLQDVPCIVIPCATTFGRFAIEVSIKTVSKSA